MIIKRIDLDLSKRIICISDIHGSLSLFKSLLRKVQYTPLDYLIIIGDMVEKGPQSLETLHYIMSLQKASEQVIVIRGNCENTIYGLLNRNLEFISYLKWRYHTLVGECLRNYSLSYLELPMDLLHDYFVSNYGYLIDWINRLPTIVFNNQFIFVHAGLDTDNWLESTTPVCLKSNRFYDLNHQANQMVIVGHYPVSGYGEQYSNDQPIIDFNKRIIAIDGGNVVRTAGQLNALIIKNGEYTFDFVSSYKTKALNNHCLPLSTLQTNICWPNYEIEIVEKGLDFTRCIYTYNQEECLVKNEYIITENNTLKVKDDLSCYFFKLNKGDIVEIIDDSFDNYAYVKHKSITGWIPKNVL